MFCTSCGNKLKVEQTYCTNCGKKIIKEKTISYETKNLRVSFSDAIKNYYINYFNFRGRATRAEYWWIILYTNLISFQITFFINLYSSLYMNIVSNINYTIAAFLTIPGIIWILAHIIPTISLTVRRLHDVGEKGYYYFIILIPFVGAILFYITMCEKSTIGEKTPNADSVICCSDIKHEMYRKQITSVGKNTTDGCWKYNYVLGERTFICNHCNTTIAYEEEFVNSNI